MLGYLHIWEYLFKKEMSWRGSFVFSNFRLLCSWYAKLGWFQIWTSVNVSLDFFEWAILVIWKSSCFLWCFIAPSISRHQCSVVIFLYPLSMRTHFTKKQSRKKIINKLDQHKIGKFKNIEQENANKMLYTK